MITRLALLAVTVLSTGTSAFAFQPKNLLGNWTGNHKELKSSGTGVTVKCIMKGTQNAAGTVLLRETAPSLGIAASYFFKKDGHFSCQTVQAGVVVLSSYRGTWKGGNGQFSITGSGTLGSLKGVIKQTSTGFKFSGKVGITTVTITAKR